MQPSVWYHVDEKLPDKSGTYMTFVGSSLGSDEVGTGTSYYNSRFAHHGSRWRASLAPHSAWVNVVYWCNADPHTWYDNEYRLDSTPVALVDAWTEVQRAISRYEMIRALTTETR
jgi:hypothetical protein